MKYLALNVRMKNYRYYYCVTVIATPQSLHHSILGKESKKMTSAKEKCRKSDEPRDRGSANITQTIKRKSEKDRKEDTKEEIA